ncbi:type II toxin-antitoxin system tRNA(fMet)-specific endonuclease VapC [Thalassospira povalilytica]|uniref:type II toxin-antitoxin system tRNA(fMet)-specific endonuclease VapC n=1 Tax=Thalassospira povalilytica TaxID=732237 RepID=UPI001D1972CB|nr:tRNA(fMet)-specific endonuclease VapC [Thalassospira povalilytica]MCC4241512.1 tRNA(fMet)-specific endonuclease VapC [Thalassospira povalilytica]
MLRFMLDTNICIYVIKNRPASCREKFRTHSGAMAISSVTLAELIYGAMKSAKPESNLRTIEEFAARLSVLDFDTDAAGHYGDIRSTLEREGNVIGPYDMMIAGHARSHGLILVTNNIREFERVDGLRLENWV